MGTSKSDKPVAGWVGGALLFSGRRDPTWTIDEQVAQQLIAIWDTLEPWLGELPSSPPLGYHGCFLRSPTGQEWFAYRGVVTLKAASGQKSRIDPNRIFEKRLLASAPEGTLPPNLIDDD